ncbi:flavin reductase family protein [Salinisphaera sp. S4-8]|uniref:flavin reductase family protein n=1 Tax=Salinisphaera sp. S4-8 TaxID=633357 RepID=UPI0033411CA2
MRQENLAYASSLAQPRVDGDLFRRCVSRFATGVTVVTVGDTQHGFHGTTANSFVSVSLAPPTVLISLKPGRMHDLIRREGRYGISILNDNQKDLSSHFAGQRDPGRSCGIDHHIDVPILKDSMAHLICELTSTVNVHDHTLFIGEVIGCDHQEASPLIFYGSEYANLNAAG